MVKNGKTIELSYTDAIIKSINGIGIKVIYVERQRGHTRAKNAFKKSSPYKNTTGGRSPSLKTNKITDKQQERQKIIDSLTYRLGVKQVCKFNSIVWRDKGSGANLDGIFYFPKIENSYFIIGGYGTQNDKKGNNCITTVNIPSTNPKNTPSLLVNPKDWKIIWTDKGSGADQDGSIWFAVPPNENYTCVGNVPQRGYKKPNLPKFRCVHSSLVQKITTKDLIWSDKGSGADQKFSIFKLPNSKSFFAVKGRATKGTWFELKKSASKQPSSEIVEKILAIRLDKIKKDKKQIAERRRIERKRHQQKLAKQAAMARAAKLKREKAVKKRAEQAREDKRKKEEAVRKKAIEARNDIFNNPDNQKIFSSLFEGHQNNLTFLLNTQAAGVTRGLSGDYVITQKISTVCSVSRTRYQYKSDSFAKFSHGELIKKANSKNISARKCLPLFNEKGHILVIGNNTKDVLTVPALKILVQKLKSGKYVKYIKTDFTSFETAMLAKKKAEQEKLQEKHRVEEARKREITENIRKIEEGVFAETLQGFGRLTPSSNSRTYCIEDDNKKSVFTLILKEEGINRVFVGNLDLIYINLKTKKCGYFFGKSSSLKIIAGAFKRDKIKILFSQVWGSLESLEQKIKKAKVAAEDRKQRKLQAKILRQKAIATESFVAILSCGFQGRHMNIIPCFSGGRSGVGTEVKISMGGTNKVYKSYALNRLGREYRDGLHIELKRIFRLAAQNSSDTLILGLKIKGKISGKIYVNKEAARFGMVRARNSR